MDPLTPPPAGTSSPLADPRDRIDELLSGRADRADIDVRTFLLDPPPTQEQVARTERRRQQVRRGSLASAAIIAVLLVAPWPSGGTNDPTRTVTAPEPAEEVRPHTAVTAPPRAVRLDVAPTTARPARTPRGRTATRHDPPARAAPRAAPSPSHPTHATTPRPATQRPATPRPVASQPPNPPRPTTSAAPSSGTADDAIRAPVL